MAIDHFSRQAPDYAKYRPGYPEALFSWLADRTPGHDLAWDVGCGSGQAAVQRCLAGTGQDPTHELFARLRPHWGDPAAVHEIVWPIALLAGHAK